MTNAECTQLAYNKLCNYNHEVMQDKNYYFDLKPPGPPKVEERLKRKNETYESAQWLAKIEYPYKTFEPYEYLFSIDFIHSIRQGKFFSDMSFSYRGWRMIDQLEKGEVRTEDLTAKDMELITFTILPGG